MTARDNSGTKVMVNRAPVLTLWAAIVAEQLGFDREEALTLGRAVAGLNAYAKGLALGIFQPSPEEIREKRKALRPAETITVDLLHRAVPAVHTDRGLRALSKNQPIKPESVQRYLEGKFAGTLDEVSLVMTELARSMTPSMLAASAYSLYERFRPAVPPGQKGWGAAGTLDLDLIRRLTKQRGSR